MDLYPCEMYTLPTNSFRIREHDDNSTSLATPYRNSDFDKTEFKCLTGTAGYDLGLQYDDCSVTAIFTDDGWLVELIEERFKWKFIYVDKPGKVFLLQHISTKECAYSRKDIPVPHLRPCDVADLQSHWRFIPEDFLYVSKEEPYSETERLASYNNVYIIIACVIVATTVVAGVVHRMFTRNNSVLLTQTDTFAFGDSFYNGSINQINPAINITQQVELLPFSNDWEIPLECLKIGGKLGAGAFGNVFEADALNLIGSNSITKVAVKIAEADYDFSFVKALASELKIMANIGTHPNVVKLLGACTKSFTSTRKIYVILEYCANGDLLRFLQENKSRFVNVLNSEAELIRIKDAVYTNVFSTVNLIFWAYQIASAMNFLTNSRILHGDLAARNILLTPKLVAKVSDFGFSRHLSNLKNYNYQKALKNGIFPYKWMALESMREGIFSSQSDCWSYGVLLWEMFSFGKKPYPGILVDENFINLIESGHRMSRPALCPEDVYKTMLECWHGNPVLRPKFSELANSFGRILGVSIETEFVQQESDYPKSLLNDSANGETAPTMNAETLLQETGV